MGEAADTLVISGMHTGQVACRVMYRLAHHADMLYAGIQAQRQSAEWNTAQAVIKQKRQQVSLASTSTLLSSLVVFCVGASHYSLQECEMSLWCHEYPINDISSCQRCH